MKIFKGPIGIVYLTLLLNILSFLPVEIVLSDWFTEIYGGVFFFLVYLPFPIWLVIKNHHENSRERKVNLLVSSIVILICTLFTFLSGYPEKFMEWILFREFKFRGIIDKQFFEMFLSFYILEGVIAIFVSYYLLKSNTQKNEYLINVETKNKFQKFITPCIVIVCLLTLNIYMIKGLAFENTCRDIAWEKINPKKEEKLPPTLYYKYTQGHCYFLFDNSDKNKTMEIDIKTGNVHKTDFKHSQKYFDQY